MIKNPDTGKKIGWAALAAAAGVGLYFIIRGEPEKEGVPSALTITSYENLRTGITANKPDVLDVYKGDTIRVNFQYSYFGPAISGRYHIAVWKETFGDPHNEFAFPDDLPFELPDTSESTLIEKSIDVICESFDMTPDMYALYVKIMAIPGSDIHYWSEYVLNVTNPPDGEDGRITGLVISGYTEEVFIGGTCHVTVVFHYRGPRATGKTLYAAIGNYGAFGFNEITHGTTSLEPLPESMDWVSYTATVDIPITLAIEPEDSPYDLYAKIDGEQSPILENVVTVREVVPSGFNMSRVAIDEEECTKTNKDFVGNLIPKASDDGQLDVEFWYTWGGLAIAIEIEISSGKKGFLGDYDQESRSLVYTLDIPGDSSNYFRQPIDLGYWGNRSIDDGAVEIKLKSSEATDLITHIWNAFTINQEIELKSGWNYVVWIDGDIYLEEALEDCSDYVQQVFVYWTPQEEWIIAPPRHVMHQGYLYAINLSRSCRIKNFVYE